MTQNSSSGGQGGSGTMHEMTDQAKATAGQIRDEAQQQAGRALDTAREQVASRVAGQKDRAAEGLSMVAQALRQTGNQLRDQDQQGLTNYIDRAASQVEQFSSYLQSNHVGQLVDDVEHFARRQPALFLGGAFVLGLLGARFLKSSRPQPQYSGRYPGGSSMGMGARYDTGYPRSYEIGGTPAASYGSTYGSTARSGAYPSTTTGTTARQPTASGGGARSYDERREE
jgi:hypothetical protein